MVVKVKHTPRQRQVLKRGLTLADAVAMVQHHAPTSPAVTIDWFEIWEDGDLPFQILSR